MRLNAVRRAGSLSALVVVAFAVPLSSSHLVRGQAVRTWIGGNNDWVDGTGNNANWSPADEPDADDVAAFNSADIVNLGSNNVVAGLTMSGGSDLNTNGFSLEVDGLVQLADPNTNFIASGPGLQLTADSIAVNNGGEVEIDGGIVQVIEELGAGVFDINAGGELLGHGALNLIDSVSPGTMLLINDGAISAQRNPAALFGVPQAGTLSITATDADARIDLDGASESGAVNVRRNQTLDVNLPLADAFSGTMTLLHNATLDMASAWTMNAGTINADNGFVDNLFPLPDVLADVAIISGGTFTQSGGAINVVDADGTLQFNAPFSMTGGTLNNEGHIVFKADATIAAAAAFTMGPSGADLTVGLGAAVAITQINFNLDGNAPGTVITVNPGGILALTLGDYDNDAVVNAFDATIVVDQGDFSVTSSDAEFVVDGTLTMATGAGGGSAAEWSGEPLDLGNDSGALDAHLTVTGAGIAQFNSPIDFNADADVDIAAGATLALDGLVNFDTVNGGNNAEFTGAGTLQFDAGVNVNEAVTLNLSGGTVDLDGADTVGDFINVDAPLTINAATLRDFGRTNSGGGVNTLDVNNSVGTGILTVNLDDPNAEWTLNGPGVMNLVNDNTAATLLAGNDVNLSGTVNVTGDVRVEARVDIAGMVNINTAGQPLRLSGGGHLSDTNTIAGATVNGLGQLGADTGSALHGFGTINTDVAFEGTANLLASGGTLTITGDIVQVQVIGTADDTGVLNIPNPWESDGGASGSIGSVVLNGGVLQGGVITNDLASGIQGHGLVASRVINNSKLLAGGGGPGSSLVVQTAANDNDWDGVSNAGQLAATSGATLELRDNAPFGFGGSVVVGSGSRVFANGFALNFDSGSSISLTAGKYQSTTSTDIGGSVTAHAGTPSTIQVTNNFFLTFESTSTTTLSADLHLMNNNINIEAGANFSGTGALVITEGSHLVADANANIDVLLVNDGTMRPSGFNMVGRVDVKDYEQSGTGSLIMELAGSALNQYDRLVVNGAAQLGGYLDIRVVGGFAPALGDVFNIISASGGVFGAFGTVDVSGMPSGLTLHLNYLPNAVQLQVVNTPSYSADFDNDGDVDATDLEIWQGAFNLNQLGDADGDNDSDGADFLAWQRQFGSVPAVAATAATPEPSTTLLAVTAVLAVLWRSRGAKRLQVR